MKEKELIRTIKAMNIALKGADLNNKLSMKTCITVALGFAENTLSELESQEFDKFTADRYIKAYDDESPDYIRTSIED